MVNRTKQAFVYVIVNKQNSKEYVGSTNNYERRKKDHLRLLRKNNHYNPHLQRAFNYCSDCFEFRLVGTFEDRESAFLFEQSYLDTHNLTVNGYNKKQDVKCSSKFGNGLKGRKLTEEHKNNLRGPRPNVRGRKHHNVKGAIYQYSLDGDLLCIWYDGVATTAKTLGINTTIISLNLNGKVRVAKDFIFSYKPLTQNNDQ